MSRIWIALAYCCLLIGAASVNAAVAEDDHGHIGAPAHADPSTIKTDLAIWTAVVFLSVLAILRLTAWRPIMEGLQKREQGIADQIAQAKQNNEESRRLLEEHEKKLAAAHEETLAIIEEARRDAEHTKSEIVKKAQEEAEATRQRVTRDIEQAKDIALKDLFDQAAALATGVAARIVQRDLNPDDHRDLVKKALDELASKN